MPTAVRVSDNLLNDARLHSKADKRSIAGQIEHWASIGKCAEENPDLTYEQIREIRLGLAQLAMEESSEYTFG